jgi:hypothetical protein
MLGLSSRRSPWIVSVRVPSHVLKFRTTVRQVQELKLLLIQVSGMLHPLSKSSFFYPTPAVDVSVQVSMKEQGFVDCLDLFVLQDPTLSPFGQPFLLAGLFLVARRQELDSFSIRLCLHLKLAVLSHLLPLVFCRTRQTHFF